MFAQGRITGPAVTPSPAGTLQWLALLLATVSTLWYSPLLYAAGPGSFEVTDAHTWKSGSSHLLDAQFSITLSTGAEEALENGVPLVFELQIQLVRTHRWLWDAIDTELKLTRQLQYHALSRSYLVKDLSTGTQHSYRRLKEALRAAGELREVPLTEQQNLEDNGTYSIRLRGSLDIESLPTPVRLIAYVSSAWDMGSEWYAWPLVR